MNYMADADDLKQLINSLTRLTDVLETQSASSSTYQTRAGRGGISNGVTAGNSGSAQSRKQQKDLKEAGDQFQAVLRKSSNSFELWRSALNDASGVSKVFGATLHDTINAIDGLNKKQTVQSRQVTESTIELIRANGLQSRGLKEANDRTYAFRDAMHDLVSKQKEHTHALGAAGRIVDLERERTQAAKMKGKKYDKELIAQLDEEIKQQKALHATLPDIVVALGDMRNAVKKSGIEALGTATGNAVPAIIGMEAAVDKVIDTIDNAATSSKAVADALEGLEEGLSATTKAQEVALVMEENHIKRLASARTEMLNGFKAMGKGLLASTGGVIENFRDQLKNNIRESNYTDAMMMGMSESQMSQGLGENADVFAGTSGSGDRRALLLDGTLQGLQKTITSLYGESGPEAMKRMAQVMAASQQSGMSTRENPTLVADRLKAFSEISDRVKMTKGAFTDFVADLSASGDMAYLAGKYESMSAKDAQAAVDREVEARIVNAKMMGLSTEHVRKQIQLERANRYGTMENRIQNMISGKLDMNLAKKNGVVVSADTEAVIDKQRKGFRLDDRETKVFQDFQLANRGAMLDKVNNAERNGDLSGIMQQAVFRTLSGKFGGSLDEAGMKQAEEQRATIRAKYTKEEWADFERTGKASAIYQQNGVSAADPKAYNSSLLLMDQAMNAGKTIWDGAKENPLIGSIAANTLATALATGKMAIWGTKGGGPLGSSPLAPGATPTTVAGARQAAKAAGKGVLGRFGAGAKFAAKGGGAIFGGAIGGLTGAYDGYTNSIEKGETTANAVSSGLGGGIGGGLGAWGGAAAGAAIGSVVPVVGTVIGGVIGAGVGAWLGGKGGAAVGDFAHDAVTGDFSDGVGPKTDKPLIDKKMAMTVAGAMLPMGGLALGAKALYDNKTSPMVDGKLAEAFSDTGVLSSLALALGPIATMAIGATGLLKSAFDSPSTVLEKTKMEATKQRELEAKPAQVEIVGATGEAIIKSGENSEKIAGSTKEQVGEHRKNRDVAQRKQDYKAKMAAQRASVTTNIQRMQEMEV